MNALSRFLRSLLLVVLALAGFAMALVLMAATAIALVVMYVVARLRGRPFAPAAFWQARRNAAWRFTPGQGPFGANPGAGPNAARRADPNVIDVEVREIR